MPGKIFVDTSYVLALFNTSDEFHKKAKELKKLTLSPNKVITTEAILLEIGNALSRLNLRQKCSVFIKGFYKTENVEIIPITTALIMEGRHADAGIRNPKSHPVNRLAVGPDHGFALHG